MLIDIFDLNKKKKIMTFFKKVMIFASPADDTSIFTEGQNYDQLIVILNQELKKLDIWNIMDASK